MRKSILFRVFVPLLLALMAVPPVSAQKLYKWVDDKGRVQYGDSIPPEYAKKANQELSKGGQVLKKNDAELTQEQKKQRDDEIKRKEEAEKMAIEQRRKDSALLNSYASEKDIDVIKGRSREQMEAQIHQIETRITDAEKRKKSLSQEAEFYKKGVPPKLQMQITETDEEIRLQRAQIEARKQEMAAALQKYDAEKSATLRFPSQK